MKWIELKTKILAILLGTLLTTSLSANDLKAYDQGMCPHAQCACFTPLALEKIATEIKYAETCRYALYEHQEFSKKVTTKQIEWYQEPTIIIGGVILSVGIGVFVGFVVRASK